ncbi:MAG TPA: amidase [Solirubrobacteraceae bacterium]|nr:amidase [Solirubrobacteraceae bacterium]
MDATDLCYAGAARQAQLIADGEVSSRELVQATLDRIERLQPELNAYRIVYAERALVQADQADSRRRAGERRPLLGVPVAIKDDADIAGEVTAWGSEAHGGPKEQDSEVVTRLRQAGAILIGKTNVPELTIWPFTETRAFGITRNPWSREHTPGGSSGGSGAAVAAGLCGVALGSDGAGSIRIPASFCGLFGIKPTRDTISLAPDHIDGWNGMNHYGPLARHVADAALFLDAATRREEFAAAAAQPPGKLRIAVSYKAPPGAIARLGGEQRAAIEQMAEQLRALGHEVFEREITYGGKAFGNVLVRYLRGIEQDARTMAHPERLEPRTRGMVRMGRMIPPPLLRRARKDEEAIARKMGAIFEHADAVLLPAAGGPPFRVGQFAKRGAFLTLNMVASRVPWFGPFNATGMPAAVLPAGLDSGGLPLAVQIAGPRGADGTLLALAAQVEAARDWAAQRPPLAA